MHKSGQNRLQWYPYYDALLTVISWINLAPIWPMDTLKLYRFSNRCCMEDEKVSQHCLQIQGHPICYLQISKLKKVQLTKSYLQQNVGDTYLFCCQSKSEGFSTMDGQ